jgi:hypothetical protein
MKFIFLTIILLSLQGNADELATQSDPYQNSEMFTISDDNPETQKIADAASSMNLLNHYGGYCLRFVKDILEEAGVIQREELPITAANDLKDALSKKGWFHRCKSLRVIKMGVLINPKPIQI